MQINGLREFTANFAPALRNTEVQNQNLVPNSLRNTDTLDISGAGKNILLHSTAEDVKRSRLTDSSQANKSDPITNLMDKSISGVEEILAKMYELASKAAEDETLSDLDRINMQIEMEDLRAQLAGASEDMNGEFAQIAGSSAKTDTGIAVMAGEAHDLLKTVLERARERIEKGEAWDIAEGTREIETIKEVITLDRVITPDEDGMIRLGEDDKAVLRIVSGISYETYALSEAERTVKQDDGSTVTVPTVLEKLEAAGTIILMDADSAKEGAERLEAAMKTFQAMKNEFEMFKEDPQQNRDATVTEFASLKAKYAAMKKDGLPVFLTEIGILKADGEGNNPKLVSTEGPKGAMFAKLGRFFEYLERDLASGFISEEFYVTNKFIANEIIYTEAA